LKLKKLEIEPPKKKVRDDQTVGIAEIFLDWKTKEGIKW